MESTFSRGARLGFKGSGRKGIRGVVEGNKAFDVRGVVVA